MAEFVKNEGVSKNIFQGLLSEKSTVKDFYGVVGSLLSESSKVKLGQGAGTKAGEAIMCLSVFAPPPATFDSSAFAAVTLLEGDELKNTIEVLIDLGILKETKSGRFEIADAESVTYSQRFMS